MRNIFTINGQKRELDFSADEFLVQTLRKAGYLSVKAGCETGTCGLCTVLLDGKPILSCSFLTARAEGHNITTIEGIQEKAKKVGEFLVAEGVDQCGYCSPGFIMTIIGMENELTNPTEEDISHYLMGNLCRCTGYVGQLRAIKKYLGVE